MEDNIYELNKAWRQLDESFNRIDESKKDIPKKPGVGHLGKQGKAGPHDNKKWAEMKGFKKPKHKGKVEVDENACAGATVSPPITPGNVSDPSNGVFAKKLGEKKKVVKEDFDVATLAGPQAAEAPEMEMGDDVESPAVSDIIAGLQARYPGAIIEITVTAPEGHRFSDCDINCATEVANSSETPEDLGGAWEKVGGEEEGEEGEESEEGTKPLAESYPASFGKDNAGEEKEESEDNEETEETDNEDESEGGEEEEGGEEIETASGISQDSITLSPELWSAFLTKVDSATEEPGEVESDESEENPMFEGKGPQHGVGDSSASEKRAKLQKGKDGKVTDEKGTEYEKDEDGVYYKPKKKDK